MTLALTGHGVARGIAIGRCHVVVRNELEIGEHRIEPDQVEHEIKRYRDAVEAARAQLTEMAERMDRTVAVPAHEILQTHILMLDDSTIRQNTEDHSRDELCNAEWALQTQLEELMFEFRNMEDEYIRTRGEDIPPWAGVLRAGGQVPRCGRCPEPRPRAMASRRTRATRPSGGDGVLRPTSSDGCRHRRMEC